MGFGFHSLNIFYVWFSPTWQLSHELGAHDIESVGVNVETLYDVFLDKLAKPRITQHVRTRLIHSINKLSWR